MKANVSTRDMNEAKARVEQAKQSRANAVRRLRRAEEAVTSASGDVERADEELKTASADLDQIIAKVMKFVMRKGGSDLSLAMADLIAKAMPQDDDRGEAGTGDLLDPAGHAQAPAASPAASASAPATPSATVTSDDDAPPTGGEPAAGADASDPQGQPSLLDDAA